VVQLKVKGISRSRTTKLDSKGWSSMVDAWLKAKGGFAWKEEM